MKVLKISLIISENSIIKEKEIEVLKETPKTYRLERGIIAKNKLMKIDSIFRNSIYSESPSISYYVYCLIEDRDKAIDLLFTSVRNRIRELSIGAKNLQDNLSNFKL